MDKAIDHLLYVNRDRVNAFVFLKVDIETAKASILSDQKKVEISDLVRNKITYI